LDSVWETLTPLRIEERTAVDAIRGDKGAIAEELRLTVTGGATSSDCSSACGKFPAQKSSHYPKADSPSSSCISTEVQSIDEVRQNC